MIQYCRMSQEIAAPVASARDTGDCGNFPRRVSALASEVLSWLGAGVGVGVGDGSDGSGAGGALTWAALGFVRRDGFRGHKGLFPMPRIAAVWTVRRLIPVCHGSLDESTAGAGGFVEFPFSATARLNIRRRNSDWQRLFVDGADLHQFSCVHRR